MILFLIFLGILGVDFFSKNAIHHSLPLMDWSSAYPYRGIGVFHDWYGIDFSINHVINKGAAWGLFASWQKTLNFGRLGVIALLVCYLFFSPRARVHRFPITLIISGATGNVLDYFIYGHVVDLFHFKFWGYTYPVFNVADMAIFCGIAWLLLQFSKRSHATAS